MFKFLLIYKTIIFYSYGLSQSYPYQQLTQIFNWWYKSNPTNLITNYIRRLEDWPDSIMLVKSNKKPQYNIKHDEWPLTNSIWNKYRFWEFRRQNNNPITAKPTASKPNPFSRSRRGLPYASKNSKRHDNLTYKHIGKRS